ncbi:hypothetical protein TW65_08686 [Stemphylium lycopersici]|nr:hypothetical protein TW65_08686 [Stemphylium lycopersici]
MTILWSHSIMAVTAAPWMTELPIFDMADIKLEPTTTLNLQPSTSNTTVTVESTESTPTVPLLSTTFTPTVAVQNTQGDCAAQPAGYGPIPKHDNTWGFYDSPSIQGAASNATIPPGYTLSFGSKIGSYVGANYLGHYELQSYDTLECARKCDEHGQRAHLASSRNTAADTPDHRDSPQTTDNAEGQDEKQICQGFNIYFERSPSIHLGPRCHDATSRTVIKCALWGEALPVMGATNTGYREWDFDVVIAGSNGYHLEKYKDSAGGAGNMGGRKEVTKTLVGVLAVAQLAVGLMVL